MKFVILNKNLDFICYVLFFPEIELFCKLTDVIGAGLPLLLENLEKPGIYFGSLNPGNSLEF